MLNKKQRILSIDFGERRVGVAITDRHNKYAMPLMILERHKDEQIINEIHDIIIKYNCSVLVVGLPDEFSSVHKKQIERILSFAEKLREKLDDVKVKLWSESFTSKKAVEDRPERKHVDDISATIILSTYLESQ